MTAFEILRQWPRDPPWVSQRPAGAYTPVEGTEETTAREAALAAMAWAEGSGPTITAEQAQAALPVLDRELRHHQPPQAMESLRRARDEASRIWVASRWGGR